MTTKAIRFISSVSSRGAAASQRIRSSVGAPRMNLRSERPSSSSISSFPPLGGLRRRWQSSSSLATHDNSTDDAEVQQASQNFSQQQVQAQHDKQTRRNRLEGLRDTLRQEELLGSAIRKPTDPTWQRSGASVKITTTTKTGSTTSTASNDDDDDDKDKVVDYRALAASLPEPPSTRDILKDRFDRQHTYLRISVSEKCNLRCTYCMPAEGVPLQPAAAVLQTDEILTLAQHFANTGVTKFRLTGGEPTLRKDLVDIVAGLAALNPTLIGMTTNGITLAKQLPGLVDAGLSSMNLSLDTLNEDKFAKLTRRPATYMSRVWQALEMAIGDYGVVDGNMTGSTGKKLITKLNCVVQRGVNDDEIADFIALTDQFPGLQVRFIEYMPFTDNGWNQNLLVPYLEHLQQLELQGIFLQPEPSADPHDTTKWFRTENGGKIGFITSMSSHFCAGCNRLRLSTDGQIKVCLFDGNSEISLRDAIRQGLNSQELDKLIYAAVQKKHYALGGHKDAEAISKDSANNKPMTLIGG
jgi:molybdenum cofactor biosynthesis protein A